MKKNTLLLLLTILFFCGSCNRITPEKAIEAVVTGEKDRLPLLEQQLFFIDKISIDSMRLVVIDEPMSGYLYTTWTSKGKAVPIIVAVSEISRSKEHKGYIEWNTDWESAANAYMMNLLGSI